jgi:hypothetical protein
MTPIFVLQPVSQDPLILGVIGVPKMKEKRHDLVLLSSGKGSQFFFDLLDAHEQKVRGVPPHCKHPVAD